MTGQKKLRIRAAIFAHAYEYYNESLVDDFEYDALARQIDVSISTDRPDLDKWFKENYGDHTGSWVHSHPERKRIDEITRGIICHNHEEALPPKP
jgi:hypothetical protein